MKFPRIKNFCSVKNHTVVFLNKTIKFENSDFENFSENIYKDFQINYPKFYKMDNLSKLGFLTAEILLKDYPIKEKYSTEKICVIISNKNSSLDTDAKYYEMVNKGIASPAVFVYSLPNILIGEICIRHGIKGENSFFISEEYDIPFQANYINKLLKTNDACIGGWVELMGENYESFLYLTEKSDDENLLLHTSENIDKLYKK